MNYSENYTTNTTNIECGTETYKFSRVVNVVNPSTLDNSCIYCGAENGTKYDYYPTYNYTGTQKTLMDSKWSVSGGFFNYTNHAKDIPFNICFTLCDYESNTDESGRNSVYQIGKTIYNETQSNSNSNIRVLNPVDIRKIIFYPQFTGYLGTSMAIQTVDLKYLIDHKDNFFVNEMTMTSFMWNGSDYTSTPTRLNRVRPCIVGENFFLPLMTVLSRHQFQTTDYNTQKTYSYAFYGAYDSDGMGIDYFPIEHNEKLAFTTDPTTTNIISENRNKFNCNYNYYVTDYTIFTPASQLLKLLAYCGCYFMDSSYSTSGKTLSTMWNDDHIYLGEMKEGSRTTGNFIKGTDLLTSDTINKGSFSSQTDFDPSSGSGSGGDELHDMLSRGQFYGSGLMTYYVNPPESKLQKALGSWDNISTGKDVIQNLVSYKALCFPSSTFTSGVLHDFTIAGVTLKDEQENTIQAATVTKMGGVSLPSITIPKTFNDFRDYAPYTKLSMYVPLCGWFELPPWCIGRTINGEMYINPYGGTVKCIVRADGNVVAELGGNASIDLPFNATAVGMKTAAVLSNIMSTAGATARAIMLPSPNTIAGVGSSALGLICSLNANYTESKGVMGDSTNITGLYSVYIKISRPSTIDSNGNDIKTIPETYKHENGLPCNKQLELQSGDGYTQVLEPNITGSMTATEKQMIEDGFRHGLIL